MLAPLDALVHQAETRPDATAFVFKGDRWTYARFLESVRRLATGMQHHGILPGDRVVVQMTNVPEVAAAHYACFATGALSTPINIRLKAPEIEPLMKRLRPKLYLGQREFYPLVANLPSEILPWDGRYLADLEPESSDRIAGAQPWQNLVAKTSDGFVPVTGRENEPAVLLGTSGTTGQIKFVIHTPNTLAAAAAGYAERGFSERQVMVAYCPIMHGSGFVTLLISISYGAPIILHERFDPDAILDSIERDRGTWLIGLPFMYAELLEAQRARPRDVSSLYMAASGGDVCPVTLQHDFEEVFGLPLRSFWGATEALGAMNYSQKPGPVTRVLSTVTLRIVDEAGREMPRGMIGEALLQGAMVSPGYWQEGMHGPFPTDNWLHTGDLMRRGDGDEVWFVGRKKELIIRGGSNIAPVEIETVLLGHPAVADVAVVGVPCPVMGQRVGAVIALTEGAKASTMNELREFLSTRLADYKTPEHWIVVDAIPRNNLGKVDRRASAALFVGADGLKAAS